MTSPPAAQPLLNAARAAFLRGPVAINVASRSARLVPSLARAYGCRVSEDRHLVWVFLAVARAQALLRDLEEGAPVAVIFSRPKSHVSLQLKGDSAVIRPVEAGDRAIMRAYGAAFMAEIVALGYTDAFAQALMAAVEEEAVGMGFRATTMYEQTPGPRAGECLGPTG